MRAGTLTVLISIDPQSKMYLLKDFSIAFPTPPLVLVLRGAVLTPLTPNLSPRSHRTPPPGFH